MIVVSDTSAISNLYQVGILEILHQIFGEITITPGVQRELYAIQSQAEEIEKIEWIKVRNPKNQKLVRELLEIIDLGEAESIVLALEAEANYLIIDEYKGREIASQYGLKVIGILGVLINAKKLRIVGEIAPLISHLRQIGFRLNLKLVNKILSDLGENKIQE